MLAIVKKEISVFFSSATAYLVMGLYLVLTGVVLWIFQGPFNIFESGFADLTPFFQISPWILLFLIPAVTMRSFADEKQGGTLELLLTRPVSTPVLILGKFTGSLILVLLTLLPTVLYVFTISALANPEGAIDTGSIAGSYGGLIFLAAAFTAIGVFASALSSSQAVAFLTGVGLCFVFLYGITGLSDVLSGSGILETYGIMFHYESMSRGVLSLSDLIYFFSLTLLFLILTQSTLKR